MDDTVRAGRKRFNESKVGLARTRVRRGCLVLNECLM